MNYNNPNLDPCALRAKYYGFLRITAIPTFIAAHIFIVIHIPEQKRIFEWGLLFLISVAISGIITTAYSMLIESFIETDMRNNYKNRDMLFLAKHQTRFKSVRHINNSQVKHLKENRTKYHERNNRTIRRIINTRSKKK